MLWFQFCKINRPIKKITFPVWLSIVNFRCRYSFLSTTSSETCTLCVALRSVCYVHIDTLYLRSAAAVEHVSCIAWHGTIWGYIPPLRRASLGTFFFGAMGEPPTTNSCTEMSQLNVLRNLWKQLVKFAGAVKLLASNYCWACRVQNLTMNYWAR